MKNRKYLFVVGQLGNGGLERQLYYLCTQMVSSDYEVYVICWNYENEQYYFKQFQKILNDRLIIFDSKESKVSKIIKLRKIIKIEKFTDIVSFSGFTNFLIYISSFGYGAKTYGSLRTSFSYYIKKQKVKAMINLCFPKRILVNSISAQNEAKKNRMISLRTDFRLLQNVVDIQNILNRANEIYIDVDKKYFNTISIGNIREAKRLDRLVEVFSLIKSDYPDFLIKHIHIGGGELAWLQALIDKKELTDIIHLKGQVENVYPYIKSADLLLHFSDVEGASNVIMEGMSLSKAIVSTDCGDTSLYVKDGETGFLIKPFKKEEFSAHIFRLANDRKMLEDISERSFFEIKKYDVDHAMAFFQAVVD